MFSKAILFAASLTEAAPPEQLYELVSKFKITIGNYTTDALVYDTYFKGYCSVADRGADGEDFYIGSVTQVQGETLGGWFYTSTSVRLGIQYATLTMQFSGLKDSAQELLIVDDTTGLSVASVVQNSYTKSEFYRLDATGTNSDAYKFSQALVSGETHTISVYKVA